MTSAPPIAGSNVIGAFRALVRIFTPFLISTVIAIALHFGKHLDPATAMTWLLAIGSFLTIAVRFLESRFPWLGYLLGIPGQPTYPPTKREQQLRSLLDQAVTYSAQLEAANRLIDELKTKLPEAPAPGAGSPAPPAVAPPVTG